MVIDDASREQRKQKEIRKRQARVRQAVGAYLHGSTRRQPGAVKCKHLEGPRLFEESTTTHG